MNSHTFLYVILWMPAHGFVLLSTIFIFSQHGLFVNTFLYSKGIFFVYFIEQSLDTVLNKTDKDLALMKQ